MDRDRAVWMMYVCTPTRAVALVDTLLLPIQLSFARSAFFHGAAPKQPAAAIDLNPRRLTTSPPHTTIGASGRACRRWSNTVRRSIWADRWMDAFGPRLLQLSHTFIHTGRYTDITFGLLAAVARALRISPLELEGPDSVRTDMHPDARYVVLVD